MPERPKHDDSIFEKKRLFNKIGLAQEVLSLALLGLVSGVVVDMKAITNAEEEEMERISEQAENSACKEFPERYLAMQSIQGTMREELMKAVAPVTLATILDELVELEMFGENPELNFLDMRGSTDKLQDINDQLEEIKKAMEEMQDSGLCFKLESRSKQGGFTEIMRNYLRLLRAKSRMTSSFMYKLMISEKSPTNIATDIVRAPLLISEVFHSFRREIQRLDRLMAEILAVAEQSSYISEDPSVPPTNSVILNKIYEEAGGEISLEEVVEKIGPVKKKTGKKKSAWKRLFGK